MNSFELGFFDELIKVASASASPVEPMVVTYDMLGNTRWRGPKEFLPDYFEDNPRVRTMRRPIPGTNDHELVVFDSPPEVDKEPYTNKHLLLDLGLSTAGQLAGSHLGATLGKSRKAQLYGQFLGGAVGPAITAATRLNKDLYNEALEPKFSRRKAAAITGLLGAALGASAPIGNGGARQRLSNALALGVPAALGGAMFPSVFGTYQLDVRDR
jgi:hypothetical protein